MSDLAVVVVQAEPISIVVEDPAPLVVVVGETGPQGLKGDQGDQGEVGPQGVQGDTGPQGVIGPQGIQGVQGDVGPDGATGPQGTQGISGNDGADSTVAGPQGIQGVAGDTGPQGSQGVQGDQGIQGPAGNDGSTDATTLNGVAAANYMRTNAAGIRTAGTITYNDNIKIGLGTLNAEGTLYSNGTKVLLNLGANKDFQINNNGTSKFLFDSSAGAIHADGGIKAASTSVGSDRKLKKNIRAIENASDKIDALVGVRYDLKKTNTPDAGLIAQDVQGVLPEAVTEEPLIGGEEGATYLSLNYNAVVGLLVAGFQEEKNKRMELERRLIRMGG